MILEHFADNREEQELANYGMLFRSNLNDAYCKIAKGNEANPNWILYQERGWNDPP